MEQKGNLSLLGIKAEASFCTPKMRWKLAAKIISLLILTPIIFGTGAVYAKNWDSVLLKFRPKDTWSPVPITDLSAESAEKEGQVTLKWTAPRDVMSLCLNKKVQGYKIAFDTFSIDSFADDTTSWWNAARGFYQIDFAHSPGETETLNLYPLTPGVKYYFAIKSYDEAEPPNESPIDTWAASVINQACCVVLDVVPEAPVGLSALAGDTVADLTWSANTEIDIAGYIVYYDTVPGPPYREHLMVGNLTTHHLTNLVNFTTYHIAITVYDRTGHESEYSGEVTAYPGDWVAPAKITDLTAETAEENQITLSWTAPGDDGWDGQITDGSFQISYSTDYRLPITDYQVTISTSCSPMTVHRLPITGLQGDTTYYFCVRTADEVPNWSEASNIASAQTLDNVPPQPVSGFTAVAQWGMEIRLSWINPKDADYAGTRIYASTTSPSPQPSPLKGEGVRVRVSPVQGEEFLVYEGTGTSFVHKELIPLVTYYYAAVTYDEVPNYSTAVTTSAMSLPVLDAVAPAEPWGVRGRLAQDLKHIIISWTPVEKNADGTKCDDLGGYIIYRASGLGGSWEPASPRLKPHTTSWTEPQDISGHVFSNPYYYKVRAMDNFFRPNESEDSMIVDTTLKTNIIAVSTATLTHIQMPKEVNQILYKETNPYKEDIKIIVNTETPPADEKRLIGGWEFVALKASDRKPVEKFEFARPEVSIILRYEVVDGRVGRSRSPAKTPSPEPSDIPANEAARQLAVFWFNGIEWIKIGGKVDPVYQTISLKSKYLGQYQIRHCLRAEKFTLTDIYPKKIFTPNGDGDNDVINFQFENPSYDPVSGKIYDLTGAIVATMEKGDFGDWSLKWDGTDEDGNVAPSGVYIYQIECRKAVANGTVVLAK